MTPAARKKVARRRVRVPRQARSQATVEAILTAAARVLARGGWAGFTTNAVAARAGVSIGSLYEYFRDKQALVDGLLERHLARAEALVAERAAQLGGRLPVPRLVAAMVDGFVALHADDPRLHRVLSSEVPIRPALRRRLEGLQQSIVATLVAALAGAVPDAGLSARLIVDACEALTHRWITEPGGAPLGADVLAAELTTMLTAYLERAGLRRAANA